MRIADAGPEHLKAIAEIYNREVRDSPVTFDLEPPDGEQWRAALRGCDPNAGRFLIVALDGSNDVLAYAKTGPFRDRAAYDSTCETSIYVDRSARGHGIGTALYSRLIELLEQSPLRLAVAGITEPNPASIALHEALGFERVGTFNEVGVKFGRAWDVTWYQRSLRPH